MINVGDRIRIVRNVPYFPPKLWGKTGVIVTGASDTPGFEYHFCFDDARLGTGSCPAKLGETPILELSRPTKGLSGNAKQRRKQRRINEGEL
jgi:hypothetical protein